MIFIKSETKVQVLATNEFKGEIAMIRSHFKIYIIAVVIGFMVIVFTVSWQSIAQQTTTILSGRVVDAQENGVEGIEVGFSPVDITNSDGYLSPIGKIYRSNTDEDGNYSINNIPSVPSQLILLHEHTSEYRIEKAEIEGLTFYASKYNSLQKLPIIVERGKHLKDVLVTVHPRMRIRGQIILKDGTPLSNTNVKLNINPARFWDNVRSRFEGTITTDSDGYFSEFVREAATYTVSVEYSKFKSVSEPIPLKDGEQYSNLVLRLNESIPSDNSDKSDISDTESQMNSSERWRALQAVWTVNPTNGHAYRTIRCESWREARNIAEAHNAYLTTINDDDEQHWVESLYSKKSFYWIGLRHTSKGADWHNQGTVPYTNWADQKSDGMPTGEAEVYVAMDAATKKWVHINSNSPFRYLIRNAIIEKDAHPINPE